MAPCCSVRRDHRFGGAYCYHFHRRRLDVECSLEALLVIYETTRFNDSEDKYLCCLHLHLYPVNRGIKFLLNIRDHVQD